MDSLRSNFDAADDAQFENAVEDDIGHDGPPPGIGTDERRMQVRAYNFWASLLENRNFPSIEDLNPETLPDIGANSVLLDFSVGAENPGIAFLGQNLAVECGASGLEITHLEDVPSRSLLSRITDHYMQIIANQAPIGFEAEFVNQRGATILYRGILLPFSSDDDTIDFIYGVINWKELADQQAADELLLAIDQALEQPHRSPSRRGAEISDWADGPGAIEEEESSDKAVVSDLPRAKFGMEELQGYITDPYAALSPPKADPTTMQLADWLAAAREMAQAAHSSEDRTRHALYIAIGHAYDFSLAAMGEPEEFAALLEDSGLKTQVRAPMTPVVKLVFGADYDKTRLTEYAAALAHAHRLGLIRGGLCQHLGEAEGGLKGVVQAERRLRREESGKPAASAKTGPGKAIAGKLRALTPQDITAIDPQGSEFALVMIRRQFGSEIAVLGEVPDDQRMVEKAARRLLG